MADNILVEGSSIHLSVACSNPATPSSGDPIRWGSVTGIALTDEGDGGNVSTNTTVKLGLFVTEVLVDDNETGGIAVGDLLYYHDTATGSPTTNINNTATSGTLFGMAMETVADEATTTIKVLHLM